MCFIMLGLQHSWLVIVFECVRYGYRCLGAVSWDLYYGSRMNARAIPSFPPRVPQVVWHRTAGWRGGGYRCFASVWSLSMHIILQESGSESKGVRIESSLVFQPQA